MKTSLLVLLVLTLTSRVIAREPFIPTPDVFTQLLLAVPMYLLYEISILVVKVSGKRK